MQKNLYHSVLVSVLKGLKLDLFFLNQQKKTI